ncbi:zinc-finger-containing protein [Shewanella fodinae]|uniref:zinc-finger-containing protein n=1 Tax=Shewanella fodinae TaxID=552357 RepID=UPI001673FD7A|nr:zinc-finger-containing protein [Shewanella fodinae]MCL2905191.1 DUF3268 family zinc-finger domain-containing protein [Shewanella fodinae]GGY87892.1 hypothetical protein GCM10007169_01330 [Shewanella fodinae]
MTDTRAFSKEKLIPQSPLPYISRKALKRVGDDALPIPTKCECGGKVILSKNSVIYNGKEYGDWPFVYHCTCCDRYVGLHPNTDIPLGTLADKCLRDARKSCKPPFNKIWQLGFMSRDEAYIWLANKLDIDKTKCHFGLFDENMCEKARTLCEDFFTKNKVKVNLRTGEIHA